jgi:hypothetical protein
MVLGRATVLLIVSKEAEMKGTIRGMAYGAMLVLCFGLSAGEEASAQECVPNMQEICVYDQPNLGGGWNKMTRQYAPTAAGPVFGAYYHPSTFPVGVLDNWISSIEVGPNTRVRICEHADWGGFCEDLTSGGWNMGSLSNKISSIRINWSDQSCQDGPNWPIWPGEVSIHQHANQSGDCTTKDLELTRIFEDEAQQSGDTMYGVP